MNTIVSTILSRRSVRNFTEDAISGEQIELLLRAAMYAPSAVNSQPWHFIVVTERSALDKIIAVHPYTRALATAGAAIIVCADESACPIPGYWQQDCAAATQNILLAAHELGLGTCWCGVSPRKERMDPIIEMFNIPNGYSPFNVIAVGVPCGEPEQPSDRWKPERIHIGKW